MSNDTATQDLTTEQIKARLYDLQAHYCNGRMTFRANGMRDPNDKPCDYCLEVAVLVRELRLRSKGCEA